MKFLKASTITTVIIIILVLIIIGGGVWYFIANKPVACTEEAKLCPDGTAVGRTGKNCEFAECPIMDQFKDWNTYKNEEYGFEMKYPNDFPIYSIQPITTAINCDYANFSSKCPTVSSGGQSSSTTERININGILYCSYVTAEGAAGTVYKTYGYATVRNNKCFVVSFAVAYPNCDNYLPVENSDMQKAYDKCKLENEVTKPAKIDQIISTFKFIDSSI